MTHSAFQHGISTSAYYRFHNVNQPWCLQFNKQEKTFASYLLNIFKYVQEISTISKITVNFISCVFQV